VGVNLLGPVEVEGGSSLEPRDRAVLAVLAIRRGQVVTPAQIADALWRDSPPGSWPKQVQICVGRIRRVLGATAVETSGGGYRLALDDDEIDARRFELLVERGRTLTASGEPDRAAATFSRALGLWRGPPLENLDGWLPARGEAARLEELHRTAEEDWLDARLAAGDHREVAAEAEAMVKAEPLRERRWRSLALAQYRCARQGDALRTLARARQTLVEQLGVSPGPELAALEAAILRQDPALGTVAEAAAVSVECPYRGLAPFDEADAHSFFGRDAETVACLQRLHAHPFLVVAGPSGCGKSSLVRAGVASALRHRGHDVVVIVPGSDPHGAAATIRATTDRTVIVVDQFEELFALDHPPDVVSDLCRALVTHAGGGGSVVLAVRSDRLGALSGEPELSRLVERGLHLVTPLAGDALRQAIEEPARLAGLRLEHGLVELLVRDCEGEPGGLPMLSHALVETWRRRDGATLTVEGYRASGGIRGAVARSADRLYDGLPAVERSTLRAVLLRLVTPSLDGDPVRCRVPSRNLLGDPQRERVVGLLVRARLVTAEDESFEVAHEALARAWPRLRSWLDEDVAGQRILRHMSASADGWDTLGRPDTELYRGGRLETALEWRDHADPQLTELEQSFLDASQEHAHSERRVLLERAARDTATKRRLRRLLVLSAVLVVAAVIAGLVAVRQAGRADTERDRADDERELAAIRELAATAMADVDVDPERSALLALAALDRAGPDGGFARGGIEQALHDSISALRVEHRLPDGGWTADWSPDGRRILTTGRGAGDAKVIDVASGRIVHSFSTNGAGANDIEDSPDGSLIAIAGRDGTVRVLDDATGEASFDVMGEGAAWQLAFSPDGKSLAATWRDDGGGLVRIVDVADGSVSGEMSWPGVFSVAFSPDGSALAVISSSSGAVLDMVTGRQVAPLTNSFGELTNVAWSPDGRLIALGRTTGSAALHDAHTGEQLMVLPGHGSQVLGVGWSPDSTLLATASSDGTATTWLLSEGGGRRLVSVTADDVRSGFSEVAFSPDGSRIVTSGRGGTTLVWRADPNATAEVAYLPGAAFGPGEVRFIDDGHRLLATGGGGTVTVWDTATWREMGRLGPGGRPEPGPFGPPLWTPMDIHLLGPSPDGALAAAIPVEAATGGGGTLSVYDVDGGPDGFTVDVGTQLSDAAWSNDGQLLAVGGTDRDGVATTQITDRTGRVLATLRFPGRFIESARFIADGRLVIAHSQAGPYEPGSGRVQIWNWRDNELFDTIEVDAWYAVPHPTEPLVAIVPNGEAADQTVTIRNLDTGIVVATLAGNTGFIEELTFSSDGTQIATANGDGSVHVWDTASGQQKLTLRGHLGRVYSVSFSANGRWLASYSAGGDVRVWSLDLDEVADIARQRVTRPLTDSECQRYLRQTSCDPG
jgi:WD40 repeat protein/DNA-binding SARP family transcriptional activator